MITIALLTSLVLIFVAIAIGICLYIYINFKLSPGPPIADYTYGGLFQLNFTKLQSKPKLIREIIPSQFPKANIIEKYHYNYSHFGNRNTQIVSNRLSPKELLRITFKNTTILTPFFMDDKSNVIMVQTPQQICLTDNEHTKTAFFCQAQATFCNNKIYSVPFEVWPSIVTEIRQKLNEIDYEILFVHNMGRCGGNFICNLLSNHKSVQCVKETNILNHIQTLYSHRIRYDKSLINDRAETFNKNISDLIEAVSIMLIYNVLKNADYKKNKIVFKEASNVINIAHLICKALSKYNCKHIYLYRNVFDQIDSMYSLFTFEFSISTSTSNACNWIKENVVRMGTKYKYIKHYFIKIMQYLLLQRQFGGKVKNCRRLANLWAGITEQQLLNEIKTLNALPVILMHWCNSVNIAFELLENGEFMTAIRYKDLKKSPLAVTNKLLLRLNWINANIELEIDNKSLITDSHNLIGGHKSHRKSREEFVILSKKDIQFINQNVEFSKYTTLNEKYCLS